MKRVFIALIEVRPLEGCQLDPKEYLGAAVRLYIPAESEDSAQNEMLLSLTENRFELTEMEFLVAQDEVEWENPNEQTHNQLSKEALDCDEVIYGNFIGWDTLEEE